MKKCPQCQTTYPDSASFCPRDAAALTAVDAFAAGMTIRRKYRIISEIGRGGMGVVYRAQHLLFQEERALKVVSTAFAADPRFAGRFLAEVMITRQLRHPNIVRVEDADETEDGQPFAVMEYVAGESLRHVIRREGALEPARALYIAAQVCAALAAAHQHGIIHRDIKPDNILLVPRPGRSELVKVLDFGIAKVKEEAAISLPEVTSTKTGFFVGTPEYASPEQALGKKGAELDERTDLYSLGVVLYEMLSGRLPFHADTPMGMLLHQIQTPAERPCLDLPESVHAVIMRSLAKDTAQRFSSAEEMRLALEQAAHELRQAHGVPTPPELPSAETRRQFVPTPPSPQARAAAAASVPQPAQVSGRAQPGPISQPAHTVPAGQAPTAIQPPATIPQQQLPQVRTRSNVILGIAAVCLFGVLGGVYLLWLRSGSQVTPARPEPARVDKVEETPPHKTVEAPPPPPTNAVPEAPKQPAGETQPDAGRSGRGAAAAKQKDAGRSPEEPARVSPPAGAKSAADGNAAAAKKNEAGPGPTPAVATEPGYVLVLVGLSNRQRAEEFLRAVKSRGFEARIVQDPDDPLFRVLLGPFASRTQAEDLRARLEMQGFKPVLVRWPVGARALKQLR